MLTLLLALALAGCGDDDGRGGGGGPTKEEFIERADELCRDNDERGTELVEQSFADVQNPTGAEAVAFAKAAVPVQRELLAELRELERPEGDKAEIERWLDAVDAGVDEVDAASDDPEKILAFLRAGDSAGPLAEADALATEYGFDVCSN